MSGISVESGRSGQGGARFRRRPDGNARSATHGSRKSFAYNVFGNEKRAGGKPPGVRTRDRVSEIGHGRAPSARRARSPSAVASCRPARRYRGRRLAVRSGVQAPFPLRTAEAIRIPSGPARVHRARAAAHLQPVHLAAPGQDLEAPGPGRHGVPAGHGVHAVGGPAGDAPPGPAEAALAVHHVPVADPEVERAAGRAGRSMRRTAGPGRRAPGSAPVT